MQIKKILSIAMALTLSFGAVQPIGSAYAKEKDKHADYSGFGWEKFTCATYERETGRLILHGKIVAEELAYSAHFFKVKEIVTENGTEFPEDSSFLFYDFKDVTSIDLTGADTSKVTDMYDMFCGCESAETINLGEMDTSKVTRMDLMFNNCYKLKKIIGLDKFDTSSVYTLNGMFASCHTLTSIDISNFDTSKVTDMAGMFGNCIKLENVRGLSDLDVSNVKKMSFMFEGCKAIESLQLQYWDTSKVTTMESMFANCTSLKEASFDENAIDAIFQTYNVSTFENMFLNCKSLQTLKLDNFSAKSAQNTSGMFMNCENLEWISLTDFAASKKLRSTSNMFSGCSNLETIYMDEDWPDSFKENVMFADNMFLDCTKLKGQNGTIYDPDKVGPQYAVLDRAGTPGYFYGHAGYFLPIMPELGDTNNDGRVDATDASNILNKYAEYATSKQSPTAYELEVYDVNRDGRVNATDASYVLDYYAYTQTGGTDSFADYMKKH